MWDKGWPLCLVISLGQKSQEESGRETTRQSPRGLSHHREKGESGAHITRLGFPHVDPGSHGVLGQILSCHFRPLKTLPGCVPFLPCRKVFEHLTTFLSVARSLRGCQGAPPRLHLKIKVVLTTLLEQQILSGYKKSSFSPKVLNSNHVQSGKVHARLFSLTGPA